MMNQEIRYSDVSYAKLAMKPPAEEPKYTPHRLFVNNVDSYFSRHIAAYIADKFYGALKMGQGAEEGDEEAPEALPSPVAQDLYQIVGSLHRKSGKPTEDIQEVVNENDPLFEEKIRYCGTIIYDITSNPDEIPKAMETLAILTRQLDELKEIGEKTYEQFNQPKTFILVSPIMTWALTKPLDPDDPELPLSEVDYRKRRPHPNYRKHYCCERDVMKTEKKYTPDKIKTYVVCSGIMYGLEENDLFMLFKMAWYNETMPMFDNGSNIVPLIHIKDLAKVIHGLIENLPRKPKYILAIEQTPSTLKQIITSLSKTMSSGRVNNVVKEEAFLMKNMTQTIFERYTLNLNMEPVFIVENLQIPWQNEAPLPETMKQICTEFKTAHKLKPIKIVVHGPPGCGKTQLAKKIADYYHIHYISTATMIDELLAEWKENLARAQKPKEAPTEMLGEENLEEMEEEDEDPATILERIREIELLKENGVDQMPDDVLIGLARGYLQANKCQNRGYVLDDFPKIIEQAKELFAVGGGGGGGEGGEEEEEDAGPDAGKILPDLVVSVQATDDNICKKAMSLKESEIKDTEYSEENLLKRLEVYRELDTEDNTVLNFYDELEVDIMLSDVDESVEEVYELILKKFGEPVGFGLTPEELDALYEMEEKERQLGLEREEINRQLEKERAEGERKEKMEKWAETLTRLQMEEEKLLIAQSEPLRHYLMKFVFPTLTKGLIELARLKPDDPVDFLAEYLFKQNPEGKMFDPCYNRAGEELEEDFEEDVRNLIEKAASDASIGEMK